MYEVLTIQRDFGNRSDRKLARLKYTLDKMGVDVFKKELEQRCGFAIEPARSYAFTERIDRYGWLRDYKGNWHYTVFVENGRVTDEADVPLKTALLELAETNKLIFRFTSNQNLILSEIADSDKALIESILNRYGIIERDKAISALRKNAISCVALPTCPLALAEAQRYLPTLISKIEPLLEKHGLADKNIITRMTGCPNGCARPYAAEIGWVGTGPGRYNLHIGGDREGTRLNTKYREQLDENGILETLDGLFDQYKKTKPNMKTSAISHKEFYYKATITIMKFFEPTPTVTKRRRCCR